VESGTLVQLICLVKERNIAMFRLDEKIALVTGSTLVIDGGWTAK
jgi:hypothetical protein